MNIKTSRNYSGSAYIDPNSTYSLQHTIGNNIKKIKENDIKKITSNKDLDKNIYGNNILKEIGVLPGNDINNIDTKYITIIKKESFYYYDHGYELFNENKCVYKHIFLNDIDLSRDNSHVKIKKELKLYKLDKFCEVLKNQIKPKIYDDYINFIENMGSNNLLLEETETSIKIFSDIREIIKANLLDGFINLMGEIILYNKTENYEYVSKDEEEKLKKLKELKIEDIKGEQTKFKGLNIQERKKEEENKI